MVKLREFGDTDNHIRGQALLGSTSSFASLMRKVSGRIRLANRPPPLGGGLSIEFDFQTRQTDASCDP